MNLRKWYLSVVLLALFVLGCGTKVMVPPEVDLSKYGSVGLVAFSSNTEGNLDEYVTQKFLETVRKSQQGARIIELGTEDRVLDAVKQEKTGPEAIQAIGEKYDVGAVITGNLVVSSVKPKVSLSTVFTTLSVQADVQASLAAKLFETDRGSTEWLDSAQDKKRVAQVSIFSEGGFHFDARDPEEAYGKLVESLVKKVTRDLRVRWKRR